MQNKFLAKCFIVVMCMVAFTVQAENLIPPKDRASGQVNQDMNFCFSQAQRGGEIIKGFDEKLLHGYSTAGYLFPAFAERPVEPRADGVLAPAKSLFDGMKSVSTTNPYVVCLLMAGYRWESVLDSGMDELKKMADRGDVAAQLRIGFWYYNGLPVTRNYSNSFFYLNKSAQAGNAEAQLYLSSLYHEGEGVLPDDVVSLDWLKKSALGGNEKAQSVLTRAENQMPEIVKSRAAMAAQFDALKIQAEQGDVSAQKKIANFYIEGLGTSADASLAIAWYQKAALQSDAESMRQIGVIYDKGRGVPVDYVAAEKWQRKSAELGDAQAQYNLAIYLYYGIGTPQNKVEAISWMSKSADQKYARAIAGLQRLH